MSKSAKREARQSRYQSRRRRNILLVVGVGMLGLGALGFLLIQADEPAAGEAQDIMASRQHLQVGSDFDHNTDPPTSGPHYEVPLEPGFYEQSDLDGMGADPDGFLVHSLEHGYVIFWYNCEVAGASECEEIKTGIQDILADDGFKLIAVPRESTKVALVMTTWGQMLELDEFDRSAALDFINRNRGRAPEPNAR